MTQTTGSIFVVVLIAATAVGFGAVMYSWTGPGAGASGQPTGAALATTTPSETANETETETAAETANETPTETETAAATETETETANETETETATDTPTETGAGSEDDEPSDDAESSGSDDESGDEESDCLANPYDYEQEDEYEYQKYNAWMPDRFAEDIVETNGVLALYAGMEGHQGGLAHLVETESSEEPVVYCRANEAEGYIYTDYGDGMKAVASDDSFTPTTSRWTVDPTYEQGMGISDQSVDWLLNQSHVHSVVSETECDSPDTDCRTEVTVVTRGEYPPSSDRYWEYLPDTIDGYNVTYQSRHEAS